MNTEDVRVLIHILVVYSGFISIFIIIWGWRWGGGDPEMIPFTRESKENPDFSWIVSIFGDDINMQ